MTDGTGTTLYSYIPVTFPPLPGAGQLASVDGPLDNDIITYGYDELRRRVRTSINQVTSAKTNDAANRLVTESNALGTFAFGYDGGSARMTAEAYPNGQTGAWSYMDNFHDVDPAAD